MSYLTLKSRKQADDLFKIIGEENIQSVQIFECPRGQHKFDIGQNLEICNMQQFPELNGVKVIVTGYRKSDNSDRLAYYVKSDNTDFEKYFNFTYEDRLKAIE